MLNFMRHFLRSYRLLGSGQHEEPTNHRSKNPLYFQRKSLPTAAKLQR